MLKKSFYRAFNAVFGKVGRVASQNVVIELLMSKCVPVLYYGSECCPISKSQFHSLEFALRGSFMKLFDTRSKDIVLYCMNMLNVSSPYHDITRMWANAQPDGRPAEHRWRPLFNAAKFG